MITYFSEIIFTDIRLGNNDCSTSCSATAACSSRYDLQFGVVNSNFGVPQLNYLAKTSLINDLQFNCTKMSPPTTSPTTPLLQLPSTIEKQILDNVRVMNCVHVRIIIITYIHCRFMKALLLTYYISYVYNCHTQRQTWHTCTQTQTNYVHTWLYY